MFSLPIFLLVLLICCAVAFIGSGGAPIEEEEARPPRQVKEVPPMEEQRYPLGPRSPVRGARELAPLSPFDATIIPQHHPGDPFQRPVDADFYPRGQMPVQTPLERRISTGMEERQTGTEEKAPSPVPSGTEEGEGFCPFHNY